MNDATRPTDDLAADAAKFRALRDQLPAGDPQRQKLGAWLADFDALEGPKPPAQTAAGVSALPLPPGPVAQSEPSRNVPTAKPDAELPALEAALALLDAAGTPLPTRRGEKRVAVAWKRYTTERPTPEEVRGWYATDPHRGVALLMGPNRLTVDVDPKSGGDPAPFLGTTPCVQRTPNDGYHFVYGVSDGASIRPATGVAPGIDIRASESIIVVAPTVVRALDGQMRAYRWEPGALEALLSGNLPEYSSVPTVVELIAKRSVGQDGPKHAPGWAAAELAAATTPIGQQDEMATKLAGYLAKQGRSEHEAITLLWDWAQRLDQRPNDPWQRENIADKVRRLLAKEAAKRPEVDTVLSGDSEVDGAAGGGQAASSASAPPAPPSLSDVGNAELFIGRHWQSVRYVPEWASGSKPKPWLRYDGKRWARDDVKSVTRLAQDTMKDLLKAAADANNQALMKHAVDALDDRGIRALLNQAQPLCAARPADFDRDPFVINCQNGTLDLRTGELRPHNPVDMLSKAVPVAYNPNATCPNWLAFLDRIFAGNARVIDYIRRLFGSAMVGVLQEQVFHIFLGVKSATGENGANGKTTLLETLLTALGDYAAHTRGEAFLVRRNPEAPRHDLYRFKDARLVGASESRRGVTLDDATIKSLCGGDTQVNRTLYAEEEEYEARSHIVLLTNQAPRIVAHDHGMWRRVRVVTFPVTIPARAQDLNYRREKLLPELAGIFAWGVTGALDVQRAGGRLEAPEEVLAASAAYRQEQDAVGRFVEERCTRERGQNVGATELHNAYVLWCLETGVEAVSLNPFREALTELGLTQRRTNKRAEWIDLRLMDARAAA